MAFAVIVKQIRHEAGAHILEGHGRPMEKFQHMIPSCCFNKGNLKIISLEDDVMQNIGWNIVPEGKSSDGISYFLQGHTAHVAQEGLRQARQPLR